MLWQFSERAAACAPLRPCRRGWRLPAVCEWVTAPVLVGGSGVRAHALACWGRVRRQPELRLPARGRSPLLRGPLPAHDLQQSPRPTEPGEEYKSEPLLWITIKAVLQLSSTQCASPSTLRPHLPQTLVYGGNQEKLKKFCDDNKTRFVVESVQGGL